MRDRDQCCLRQMRPEASYTWHFRVRIEARGRFIHEHPGGFRQQRPSDRDPLQFAAGQALRPVVVTIEPIDQMRQSRVAQHLRQVGAIISRRIVRIGDYIA